MTRKRIVKNCKNVRETKGRGISFVDLETEINIGGS